MQGVVSVVAHWLMDDNSTEPNEMIPWLMTWCMKGVVETYSIRSECEFNPMLYPNDWFSNIIQVKRF